MASESPAPTRALLIGDAPPHFEMRGQKLSSHDHVLTTDWKEACVSLRSKGIPVFTFEVGSNSQTTRDFEK